MNSSGDREIIALFCDGGVILRNPSAIGGTWAWCGVTQEGEHIREMSSYLLPETSTCPGGARVKSPVVTNNETEFYAAMRALESMPDGWAGLLASDSEVTLNRLRRIREGEHLSGFPREWYVRAFEAIRRCGEIRLKQLAGHPDRVSLERGYVIKKDGSKVRVSRHQVWCDQRCTELTRTYRERLSFPGVPYADPSVIDLAMPTDDQVAMTLDSEEAA